jgi:hypothetical protein
MAINAVIVDSISGISIKSYREIRQAIATSFTEVFGASINLEPSSPDGMFVDLLAYMYTELAQVIQTVGANIDVSTATGTFLDMLASIAGLARNEGETDESLRQRIETATFDGLATPDGMTTYLKENITDGITFKENTKNETVGGIPAHSFVIFVPATFSTEDVDPSDKDWQAILDDSTRAHTVQNFIAQKIWNCKPAGIQSYGNNSGEARDVSGFLQQVQFSFIQGVSYLVRIDFTVYDEETLPSDYEQVIKNVVCEWAKKEYTSGKDLIPQRISAPIYNDVPGIESITVTVASVDNPRHWTDERVPIDEDKIVSITAENITVSLVS